MSAITNERTKAAIDDWMAAKDGRKSRWHELFGTPERAARTLADNCEYLDYCGQCWVRAANCDGKYSTVLDWLREGTK